MIILTYHLVHRHHVKGVLIGEERDLERVGGEEIVKVKLGRERRKELGRVGPLKGKELIRNKTK